MDFFVYSRDAAGTALRDDMELLEEHWSYMDAFAESMIARGPTLRPDGETATGSLHVLGLPSVDAAREFVAREPNNCAGVYADNAIWRFENLLGRTMWAFSAVADEPRFLIIALLDRDQSAGRSNHPVPPENLPPELRDRLILYGALSSLDRAEPVGVALAVQAGERGAIAALLEDARTGFDVFENVEIHNWEFGGRR
ncbi:MAG TPA: YciI family protein [Gaiellaceae bacterium]